MSSTNNTLNVLNPITEETEIIFINEDNLESKGSLYSFDYNQENELLVKIDVLLHTNKVIPLQFISKNIIWIEQNKDDKDQLNEHIVCFWFKSMRITNEYKPPWKLKFISEHALITFLEKVNKLDI
tara:strand:+ start:756 stop:1133 length:378 start_codon:yes stop_codon:yes gene_type:complete